MPSISREILQEIGSPPALPTKRQLNSLVAKLEPERLVEVKTQMKEEIRRKFQQVEPVSTLEPVNKTHVLEMELLKLKGQFQRNKTTTMHMFKKLSNERELVKESIKELTTTRSEELNLIEAVKRDNFELIHKKHRLEMDLTELAGEMEVLLGSLDETQRSVQEKEQRMQSLEDEKLEMRKQIEAMELKLRVNNELDLKAKNFQETPTTKSSTGSVYSSENYFLIICISVILLVGLFLSYFRLKQEMAIPGSTCKDCNYERDIYTRIDI